MLSPLQSNYTGLLAVLHQMIGSIVSTVLAPAQHTFRQMASMSQWGRMDASSVPALPSELSFVAHTI